MRDFFKKTYWLWVTFKIILILILLIESIHLLSSRQLNAQETFVNSLGLIEGILLIITLIHDFSTITLKYLKIVTGSLLIIGGITMFFVLSGVSKGSEAPLFFLGYIMAIIIIMIGVFDLYYLDKPYGRYDD
jgi:hypothetical protein